MARLRFASPPALITFTLIFSIALYTRFADLPNKIVFFGDVARTMLAGRNILLGQPVLTGPLTSIPGFHLGPLYYYFTAFALKLSNFDPIGPAALVSAFGVGAIILLYIYLKRYWGNTAAVLGSIWFASSPLVMLQSRIAIEPSPLPFFTLVWLLTFLRYLETRSRKFGALALTSILIGMQLNFSAIVLIPVSLAAWWATTKRIPNAFRYNMLFLSLSGLSAIVVARTIWKPTTSLEYLWTTWKQLTFPESSMISMLAFVFLLSSLWVVNRGEGKNQLMKGHRLLLYLWSFLALIAFSLKTVNGQHALSLLFPYPFIFLGIGLQRAMDGWRKTAITLATVVFCSFLAWQARGTLQNWQGGMVADTQVIAHAILEASHGEPYTLLYKGHLDVYDAADDHIQYELWRSGNPPVDAARIGFFQETREPWLLSRTDTAKREITLYVPAPPETGFSLEVVEK